MGQRMAIRTVQFRAALLGLTCSIAAAAGPDGTQSQTTFSPEVEAFNDQLYSLPAQAFAIAMPDEERQRRWELLAALLGRLETAGYGREAFADHTDSATRPEGRDPSLLLLLAVNQLDDAALARKARVRAAVERLSANGFFANAPVVFEHGPFLWPKPKGLILEAQWPELVLAYDAGLLCLTTARLAADAGDMASAVDRLRAALGFAGVASTHPSMIGALMAAGLSQRASELLPKVLSCGGPAPMDGLASLQHDFVVWTRLPSLENACEAERILALQTAEFIYAGGDDGDALDLDRLMRIAGPDMAPGDRKLFEEAPITREADIEDINHFWNGASRIVFWPERMRMLQTWTELDGLYEFAGRRAGTMRCTVPAYLQKLITAVTKSQTFALASAWGIAACLHAIRHGALAPTLEGIDADLKLGEATDPFRFPPGASLGCIVRDIETGEFVLYSAGMDGEDNGGRTLADGDAAEALFHPRADGFDAILFEATLWPKPAMDGDPTAVRPKKPN